MLTLPLILERLKLPDSAEVNLLATFVTRTQTGAFTFAALRQRAGSPELNPIDGACGVKARA